MDYPRSVPSVGLVNGKFVDEDTATGTQGSLIPSAWGNSVTDEILSVILAAGLVPDEEDRTQLLQAIQGLSLDLASQGEAEAGEENTKYMSPLRVQQAIAKRALTVPAVTSVSVSKVLTAGDLGFVRVDASVAAVTLTLPASNAALGVRDVIVRRTDNTGNRLVVQASGAEKIKFHTHLNAAGYSFLVLMGAGDWWHLRSDGAGGWWPIGRCDGLALGRPIMDSTIVFPPGGYGSLNGALFNRAEWPWLWDHAQQSGMLTTEAARVGMEGGWTSGDGALTFRGPEARGEFFRLLDEGRGIDAGRTGGSFAVDMLRSHGHNIDSPSNPTGFGSGKIARGNRADTSGFPGSELYGGVETRPRSIAYPGRLKLI